MKSFLGQNVLPVFFCFLSVAVWGQSDSIRMKGKVSLSLEGMAGVSFGHNMVAINVGGPNLLLNIGQNWRVGLAAFPSFFVRDSRTGARLGVGGRVDFKNMVLFSSWYHFETREIWVGTIGIGYKFHKQQKRA